MRYFIVLASASLLFLPSCHTVTDTKNETAKNWAVTGGNEGVTRFSALDQINKKNVATLQVAWVYRSGDSAGNVQCNPLIVDGVMYVTTPAQEVVAVNAATGIEIWDYNPATATQKFGGINRGIALYQNKNEKRIFSTSGNYLNAIDAGTGKPISSFGHNGRVDLNKGLVRPADDMKITAPASPVLFKNLVIVGAMSWSAPANVSAFDVHTGKRVWVFHTIPQPGEAGYETWGDTTFWKNGAGVNVWGGLSVDTENGMVYFATGQPKDDFYRPHNAGAHLFANCVVALNASTGKRVWHYQVIHHDLWDLDLPCAPIQVELTKDGKTIPGLVQLTKTGNLFLFNRLTGALLSKVEERPVPGSSLLGERVYPTQPYVLWPKPFSKQVVTASDLTTISPEAHADALDRFRKAEAGWFLPPSEKGIIYYGIHGGAEWSGGAYDPRANTLYVNANDLAWHIVMRDVNNGDESGKNQTGHPGRNVYLKSGCVSCHGADGKGAGGAPKLIGINRTYKKQDVVQIIKNGRRAMPAFAQLPEDDVQLLADYLLNVKRTRKESKTKKEPLFRSLAYTKFLDKDGYPATKAPWGTLNAIDLTTGEIRWKKPLGEYTELTKKGIPVTGTENFGGCIVTAGGLVFVGASRDEKFRAFDKETGALLWETTLPFGGYATPSTYAVGGKQYVVIAATGGGKLGTKTGDTYVAFALPDATQ